MLELRWVEHDVAHAVDAVAIFDDFFGREEIGQQRVDLQRVLSFVGGGRYGS